MSLIKTPQYFKPTKKNIYLTANIRTKGKSIIQLSHKDNVKNMINITDGFAFNQLKIYAVMNSKNDITDLIELLERSEKAFDRAEKLNLEKS